MIKLSESSMHEKLKEQLLILIKNSRINQLLPSERNLAKDHGVCRATVSKVMLELERDGYITRRRGKGTFISPMDKPVLRKSMLKRTKKSEVIITYDDFYSYVTWERVHQAEFMAMQNNLNLINLKLQRESKLETIFNLVSECKNLKGILMAKTTANPSTLRQLDSLGIPVVFLDYLGTQSKISINKFENIYVVSTDHVKSGYVKMNYLLQQGHRHIAYIRNEPKTIVTQMSLEGIKQALYDHGLRLKDLLIADSPAPGPNSRVSGYNITRDFLTNNQVTALLYDTLPGNIGGLKALSELNLRCPDDISMISSSPETEYDGMTVPVLTVDTTSNEELLKNAMEIILNPDKRFNKEILTTIKLKEGNSVKKLNI